MIFVPRRHREFELNRGIFEQDFRALVLRRGSWQTSVLYGLHSRVEAAEDDGFERDLEVQTGNVS
jgi:hypothetical protein